MDRCTYTTTTFDEEQTLRCIRTTDDPHDDNGHVLSDPDTWPIFGAPAETHDTPALTTED